METEKNNWILPAALVVAVLIAAGFFMVRKGPLPETNSQTVGASQSLLPAGFPSDIPVERDRIIEDAPAYYMEQSGSSRQVSLSYSSSASISDKAAQYRSYMQNAGFEIMENGSDAGPKSLLGRKTEANISVFISEDSNGTLVQIAYMDNLQQ